MNPICWILPAACSTGQVASQFNWLSSFLSLFDTNAAGDTLRETLASIQSTYQFDLGAAGFVQTYKQLFGLMMILSTVLFFWALLSLAFNRNAGMEDFVGLAAPFKVYMFGAFLLPAAEVVKWFGQLITWIVNVLLGGDAWMGNVTQGFSFGGFWVRLFGKFETGLLHLEIIPLQLMVPLIIFMGLITYSLTTFKKNYTMGTPSRWMWALLATAFLLQPVLTAFIGLGGKLIMATHLSDGDKSLLVLLLIGMSLFLWMFVFRAINRKIKTHVENQVRIRGEVRNQPYGYQQQLIDARQTFNTRMNTINNAGYKKEGLRYARHATVDMALPALAAKTASAIHPVAGAAVHVGHAFLKGRRPPKKL